MNQITPTEKGRQQPAPAPVQPVGDPVGGGEFPVPHFATFSGTVGGSNRTYSTRFDEALRNSRENAWRMRLDPMIDACLERRACPTALLPFSIKPEDDDDPVQVEAAKRQEKLLTRLPRFVELKRWLLKEGLFVGRAGAQLVYGWTTNRDPRQMCHPVKYALLNGDKLQFTWGGEVGIAVNVGQLGQHPQVRFTDGMPCYFVNDDERQSLIIHRAFSEDADFFRPLYAGAINGAGLRGKLYWMWALKSQLWGMSIDFLRWFAKGLTVFYFEHGNNAHLQAISDYVKAQDGNSDMLYPVMRNKDGTPYLPKPIERYDASTASPAFLQELITNYLDDLIRFTILHQSLTTSTAPTGLGSGVASAHQTTFDELVKMDACMLDETLTQDIVAVMYRTNEPGVPPGKYVSQVDSPNVQQMMDAASTIVAMGGGVPQKPLTEAAGIPEAKGGDTILSNVRPQQPAAVGAIPDGQPVETAQGSDQPPVG